MSLESWIGQPGFWAIGRSYTIRSPGSQVLGIIGDGNWFENVGPA